MWTRAFGLSATLALVLATTARAQVATTSPTYELSGGYQMFHVPNQTFPFGLNVDGARHFGMIGLVAEIGWAYDSDELEGLGDADSHVWNFGAGARWTGFNSGRLWPFAQMLVGAEVLRIETDLAGIETDDTDTSFMFQPGVGINFIAAEGFGLVGQVDYRRTFFDEPDDVEDSVNNQFRVFVGARMILD